MSEDHEAEVTAIVSRLGEARAPDPASSEELFAYVYDELRMLARRYLSRERPGHTLQPTALVHEAYIKLVDQSKVDWQGRTHFFAVGARVMRNLLIDHARAKGRVKRGGGRRKVTLAEGLTPMGGRELDAEGLLALNEGLDRLAQLDSRQAKVVELRFFGGLTVPEVAMLLDVSPRTIEGDWAHARAWLKRELSRREGA
jgi:RNA polymerase sigma factor (TIGR02999 family)